MFQLSLSFIIPEKLGSVQKHLLLPPMPPVRYFGCVWETSIPTPNHSTTLSLDGKILSTLYAQLFGLYPDSKSNLENLEIWKFNILDNLYAYQNCLFLTYIYLLIEP